MFYGNVKQIICSLMAEQTGLFFAEMLQIILVLVLFTSPFLYFIVHYFYTEGRTPL